MGTIVEVKHDKATLAAYVALFKKSYGTKSKFTVEYLDWLYAKNPAGPVMGFDYVDDAQGIVSHYACIPAPIAIHGERKKAVLALNTATHPDFRGRGLFTKLAAMAFAGAGEAGYEYAYGVPNASATPGLTQKQGFSLICSLDADIGFAPVQAPRQEPPGEFTASFRRIWSAEELTWRLRDPNARWRARLGKGNVLRVWGPGPAPFIPTYEEISLDNDLRSIAAEFPSPGVLSVLPRLHLGKHPRHASRHGWAVPIPRSLRPSPLNFVVKNLHGATPDIAAGDVMFTALDFDAY